MYEGRRLTGIISNDDGVFNYFIKVKDYIVKTTRSLLGEITETLLYSLHKCFQVVYLFDCMKTQDPWKNCQGVETQKNER